MENVNGTKGKLDTMYISKNFTVVNQKYIDIAASDHRIISVKLAMDISLTQEYKPQTRMIARKELQGKLQAHKFIKLLEDDWNPLIEPARTHLPFDRSVSWEATAYSTKIPTYYTSGNSL